jgi:hypothetical protein
VIRNALSRASFSHFVRESPRGASRLLYPAAGADADFEVTGCMWTDYCSGYGVDLIDAGLQTLALKGDALPDLDARFSGVIFASRSFFRHVYCISHHLKNWVRLP